MRILLSNDDGVHAYGLKVMYEALKKLGQVWVVAPLDEKSTTGHSLTIHKPLRVLKLEDHFYGVSGGPADCVYLGIREVIGRMPDLVVSGINRGANMGQDVYYSGTVSAAREACILGLPALAVSLFIDFKAIKPEKKYHYESAAQLAVKVLKNIPTDAFPAHTLFNLNVPDKPLKQVKGVKLTRQGFRYYSGGVLRRKDHRGKEYFWVGGAYQGFRKSQHRSENSEVLMTDCDATALDYASLTPLQLDCTDSRCLAELQKNKNSIFT